MIEQVYLIRSNGDRLYSRSYLEDSDQSPSIPPHVNACVTLYLSSESTKHGHAYTLAQNNHVWIYSFFDDYAVVFLTKKGTMTTVLKKKVVSVGKALTKSFGEIMGSWSGDISHIEGIDSLIDEIVEIKTGQSEDFVDVISDIVDSALEDYRVAYVGIFDAAGKMLRGNVPQRHIRHIRPEITNGTIGQGTDMVPTEIAVSGHSVEMFKVQSYTVAVASYRGESRLEAIKAVGEVAQSLSDALFKANASAK